MNIDIIVSKKIYKQIPNIIVNDGEDFGYGHYIISDAGSGKLLKILEKYLIEYPSPAPTMLPKLQKSRKVDLLLCSIINSNETFFGMYEISVVDGDNPTYNGKDIYLNKYSL